jgi:hypothetical protein
VIRSNEASSALISSIKSAMSEMNFTVLKTQVRDGLLRERVMATLSGFFGGLATLLAMIGLYGVISYLVVRRRSEIGLLVCGWRSEQTAPILLSWCCVYCRDHRNGCGGGGCELIAGKTSGHCRPL